MIDFSSVEAIIIPEGVVVKIEAGDKILWALDTPTSILGNAKLGTMILNSINDEDTVSKLGKAILNLMILGD